MANVQPEVRYLIPCWKEPTLDGNGPTAREVMYSIKGKAGAVYPLWQGTFFVLAIVANLHGPCPFRVELRIDEPEHDAVIQTTDLLILDVGNDPLRIQPVSVMMKAAKLPRAGVYRVCFIWNDEILASATVHVM